MKKKFVFLLFLLIIFNFYKSQKYNFTTHCSINEVQLKDDLNRQSRKIQVYYNLNNSNYIAYLYPKQNLILYDFNEQKIKFFDADYLKKHNILKLISESTIRKYRDEIDINKISVDDLGNNTYSVKAYSDDFYKKNNLEIKFELVKSDYPLVQIRFLDLTKNIHDKIYQSLISKLPDENYQLEKVYYDYKNGVVMTDNFHKCENINLTFDF
jgi:hypothetical protein